MNYIGWQQTGTRAAVGREAMTYPNGVPLMGFIFAGWNLSPSADTWPSPKTVGGMYGAQLVASIAEVKAGNQNAKTQLDAYNNSLPIQIGYAAMFWSYYFTAPTICAAGSLTYSVMRQIDSQRTQDASWNALGSFMENVYAPTGIAIIAAALVWVAAGAEVGGSAAAVGDGAAVTAVPTSAPLFGAGGTILDTTSIATMAASAATDISAVTTAARLGQQVGIIPSASARPPQHAAPVAAVAPALQVTSPSPNAPKGSTILIAALAGLGALAAIL